MGKGQRERENRQEQLLKIAHIYRDAEADPIYFIKNLCKLKDQSLGEPIPFALWPKQEEQMHIWMNNDRNITLKSRQLGISWLSAAYMLHGIFFKKYFKAKVVSRKEEAAISYLDKVKFMYDHLPKIIRDQNKILTTNKLEFKLTNGAEAIAESSNIYAARSDTLNLLVFDEASIIPEGNTIYAGAEPTLRRTKGKVILIATASGYDPFFEPIFKNAIQGRSIFVANFISWQADPTTSQEWYDAQREDYKNRNREELFVQDHPTNWVEAFITSGNPVFDAQMVQTYLDAGEGEYKRFRLNHKKELVEDSRGPLKVWQKPQAGANYTIGADTAEGLEHGDYCTAAFYDRATKKQVAEYKDHVDPGEFGEILNKLGHYYNKALINVEMNNTGYATLNTLVKHCHYPRIYRQMRYDHTSNKKSKMLGWKTTNATKPVMIDVLNTGLKEHVLTPYSFDFFSELKTFVRTSTGMGVKLGATSGNHDDLVIAHALAAIVMEAEPEKAPVRRPATYRGKERFNTPVSGNRFNQTKLDRILCR